MGSINSKFKAKQASLALVLLLLASLFMSMGKGGVAHATASPSFTGGTAVSGVIGDNINITDLQVSGVTDPTVNVHLFVSDGTLSMDVTDGLDFTGSDQGNSLYFSGSQADINAALLTLKYTTGIAGSHALSASMVGAGQSYNSVNGHVYEVVSPEGGIDWNDSKTAADAKSFDGVDGYLATITSSQENDFVVDQLQAGDGWIGSSDSAVDGDWKWVDGPESDTSFYSGLANDGGHAVNDMYINWNNGEPNGATSENCGQYTANSGGRWNDLPCDFNLDTYVVEYGADGDLPVVPSKNVAITTTMPVGDTISISTCDQLLAIDDSVDNIYNHYKLSQDVDCSGVDNFEPIGKDQDGWDGDPFRGVFNGQGHTISGLNIEYDGSVVGLFEYIVGATIKNLNLTDGNITVTAGGWSGIVGSAVGMAESSTIDNITSDVSVNAQNSWAVGGIVGYTDNYDQDNMIETTVTNSAYTGIVDGLISTGGIVGAIESYDGASTTVSKSYSDATITANLLVGGIVGSVYVDSTSRDYEPDTHVNIENCYSLSAVTADDLIAGGIVGSADAYNDGYYNNVAINVDKTYSAGAVTANNYTAGGIVGDFSMANDNEQESYTISNSFVAGIVQTNSEDMPYGLVGDSGWAGESSFEFDNNYIDVDRSGMTEDSYLATGDTTFVNDDGSDADYFKNNNDNPPLDTWDFDTIWVANESTFPTFIAATDSGHETELTSAEDDSAISLAQTGCEAFTGTTTSKEADLETSDSAYSYPVGFAGFTLTGCDTGGAATITVKFTGTYNPSLVALRKYNPDTNSYTTITSDNDLTISATTLNSHPAISLSYQIVDGGPLDQDGQANGVIVDPVGLGLQALGAPNTGL